MKDEILNQIGYETKGNPRQRPEIFFAGDKPIWYKQIHVPGRIVGATFGRPSMSKPLEDIRIFSARGLRVYFNYQGKISLGQSVNEHGSLFYSDMRTANDLMNALNADDTQGLEGKSVEVWFDLLKINSPAGLSLPMPVKQIVERAKESVSDIVKACYSKQNPLYDLNDPCRLLITLREEERREWFKDLTAIKRQREEEKREWFKWFKDLTAIKEDDPFGLLKTLRKEERQREEERREEERQEEEKKRNYFNNPLLSNYR